MLGPRIGERQKQRLGIACRRPAPAAKSPDKANHSGDATTLTPMPTDHREAAAVEDGRFQQDAGELGAGRPARRSAISARNGSRRPPPSSRRDRLRHDGIERVRQRQAGDEAERRGEASHSR